MVKHFAKTHKRGLLIFTILFALGVISAICVYLYTGSAKYDFTDYQYGSKEYKSIYSFESAEELKTLVCSDSAALFEGKFTRCEITRVNPATDYLITEYSAGDDSVAATRTVYRLEMGDRGWAITGVERKRRCYTGRGNTEWHSGRCV